MSSASFDSVSKFTVLNFIRLRIPSQNTNRESRNRCDTYQGERRPMIDLIKEILESRIRFTDTRRPHEAYDSFLDELQR